MPRKHETYKARKRREVRRAQERELGVPVFADCAPIRAHVASLLEVGMTKAMISHQSGVSQATMRFLMMGRYERMRLRVAARIMQVHPAVITAGMKQVLAIGMVRRLHALQAIGWSVEDLGEQLGMSPQAVNHSCSFTVTLYSRWAAVVGVYERLSMTPGPSPRARLYAARQGWATPIEWEGFAIDDPRVEAPLFRGRCSQAFLEQEARERQQRAEELLGAGLSVPAVAERMGVTDTTVYRYLRPVREGLAS